MSSLQESEKSVVPDWVEGKLFEDVLKQTVPGYKKILNFDARSAMAAGENYSTVMLRIEIEVELNDAATKSTSFMLKIAHDNELFREMAKKGNLFAVEEGMFLDIVSEMEQMYRDVGVDVKFGANCYKLNTEQHCLLLEDLRPRGFKNADRLEGLDMKHSKCVLEKLAMWHAASATRVANKGPYPDPFTYGFFKEENLEMMTQVNDNMGQTLLKCMKNYQNANLYFDNVEKLQHKFMHKMYEAIKVDPDEFNVLSHGDLWTNNIMFQYDESGNIEETYFVDYQGPRYGTPVQDLFYFILSSTQYELKLKQFENFIKFYHEHLVENLVLLKYPKKIPTLKDLHIALYKHGIFAYQTVSVVLGAALMDSTDNSNLENFIGDSKDAVDFKMLMYSNNRYRKHMEAILPWLLNRGALEY